MTDKPRVIIFYDPDEGVVTGVHSDIPLDVLTIPENIGPGEDEFGDNFNSSEWENGNETLWKECAELRAKGS